MYCTVVPSLFDDFKFRAHKKLKAEKDDDLHIAVNWLETDPDKSAEFTRETNQENVQSIVGFARINWASECVKLWGSTLKFEAFVILQNSLKFSVGEEVCPKAVAGDYIKVTYPHCVSVFEFVIAKLEVKKKRSQTKKDFKRKEQRFNFVYTVHIVIVFSSFWLLSLF